MLINTMTQMEQLEEFMKEFEVEPNNGVDVEKIYLNEWHQESNSYSWCITDRNNKIERFNIFAEGSAFFCRLLTDKGSSFIVRFTPPYNSEFDAIIIEPNFLKQYRKKTMNVLKHTLSQTFDKFIQINHDYHIIKGSRWIDKKGKERSDDTLQCAEGICKFKNPCGRFLILTEFCYKHH